MLIHALRDSQDAFHAHGHCDETYLLLTGKFRIEKLVSSEVKWTEYDSTDGFNFVFMPRSTTHRMIVLSDFVIYLEYKNGPYNAA